MLKNNRQGRVDIIQTDENQIQLRLFDSSGSSKSHYAWKMSIREAIDLSAWWENEGIALDCRKLPVINVRYNNVELTMYVVNSLYVKGIDSYGNKKSVGWSLPVEVVEYLTEWLSEDVNQSKYKKCKG